MSSSGSDLGERIVARCLELGFAAAGVTPARPSTHEDDLRAWLAAGKHGSMAYLARYVEERLDPGRLLPGARSIIMVADLYHPRSGEDDEQGKGTAWGRIARYARGTDYHEVIKRRLHELADALRAEFAPESFRAFTDTAPVLEREHAARAGLGWVGKHTLVIHPRLGSFTLLGGIVTTLAIGEPLGQKPVTDHCGTCTRCIDACPTDAITPYSVDASRCISYLTIERRGVIPPEFHEAIGGHLFGCDICQDVCPHNSPRGAEVDVGRANDAYRPRFGTLDAREILGWTAADRSRVLSGMAIKRATLAMLKRNALIVLGNMAIAGAARREDIIVLARTASEPHEDPIVVETAAQVLRRLGA